MSATPPGWYDDGHGARRWWDGIQWTDHVQPAPVFAAPTAAAGQTASPTVYMLAGDRQTGSATPYTVPSGSHPGAAGPAAPVTYPALPPAPPKSKIWIVWTVLGVLALGAVITAIIAIPMALAGLTATAGSAGEPQSGSSAPSEEDESSAVATVRLYDDAWQEVDCSKYMATTTQAFRDEIELPDCATFEEYAQVFADSTENYVLTITDVVQDDDVITVSTSETYTNLVDEEGVALESPEEVEDLWEYYLIESGGGWIIEGAE